MESIELSTIWFNLYLASIFFNLRFSLISFSFSSIRLKYELKDDDNFDELAAAIRYLATNHGIRKQFGIDSRKLVEKDI